jgi:hypothetical protein
MLYVRLAGKATRVRSSAKLLERPKASWSHISHAEGKRPYSAATPWHERGRWYRAYQGVRDVRAPQVMRSDGGQRGLPRQA